MSRIAIYNLYWSTFGGGEQVSAAIAENLKASHEVTLLGPESVDVAIVKDRLGVDIEGCEWLDVDDDATASEASADFDVFINCTYMSRAHNRAAHGLQYVYFPGAPETSRERRNQMLLRTGLRIMKAVSKDSGRLSVIRDGFERRLPKMDWADTYSTMVACSEYSASWVRRLWNVDCGVLYPPVRPSVRPGEKGHLIASIGRFFDPSMGHCKKQADLLRGFADMVSSGVNDWRLAFVGGADAPSREYALDIRRGAIGLPVEVYLNAPRSIVEDTLASASIYWHAGGFGEDPEAHPDRFEHFGIAVVEAMAAGAVPLVFGAAGPAEIVRHGIDGFHWRTLAELTDLTRLLMHDDELRRSMSNSAMERAREFDIDAFARNLERTIAG